MENQLPPIFEQAQQYVGRGPAQVLGLLLARLVPIVSLTPISGGPETPRRFRFGLALLLALVMLPALARHFSLRATGAQYGLLLAKEAVVGLTIAAVIIILFEMLAAAGALVDLFRDASIATVFDPLASGHASVLESLMRRLTIVLFFLLGGHRMLIEALGQSFAAVPIDGMLPAAMIDASATLQVIGMFADMIVVATKLSAPIMALMLSIEVAMGLATRVAGAIDINFFTRVAKLSLGLWIFLLVLGFGLENVLGNVMGRLLRFIGG